MAIDTSLVEEFYEMCNSFRNGYLKPYKAFSILNNLQDFPAIISDNNRLLNFLDGALRMEGFRQAEIEQISAWLYEQAEK